MKNILGQKPPDFEALYGGSRYRCLFVHDEDLREREVLDVGCGYGWFELYAIRKGVGHITGIEVSPEDLRTARSSVDHPKAIFEVGSAIRLPFEADSFDTVVAWEVLEHIPRNTEITMFREVSRVLKNRGKFYLSTPHASFFSTCLDPAWWLIGHRHYTAQKLTKLADETGFKADKILLNGGWCELVWMNNLYVSKWIFRRSPFGEPFFQEKLDQEYHRGNGFTNLFARFTKA